MELDAVDGALVPDVSEQTLAGVRAPDGRGPVRRGGPNQRRVHRRYTHVPDTVTVSLQTELFNWKSGTGETKTK